MITVGLNQLIWKPELWDLGLPLLHQKDFLSFDGANFYSVFTGENLLFIQENGSMLSYIPGMFEEYLRTPWLLYVQRFFLNFAMINLGLCLFNLLPIPPLDGYHVVNDVFLRGKLHIPARVMNGIMVALMAVMFFTDIISNLLGSVIYFVQNGLLDGILWIFGLG